MKRLVPSLIVSSLIASLAACANTPPARDYESSAACTARNNQPGTPEFEDCIKEERGARMLEQQRNEYDRRKADEELWRARRF